MAIKPISQLTDAAPTSGTEFIPIVQGGATLKLPTSSFVGGKCNKVCTTTFGNNSVVAGGFYNWALALQSSIGGGYNNYIRGDGNSSTIAGGSSNCITSVRGTIAGGSSNCVTGNDGFIGGGQDNNATGCFSTVVGGGGEFENENTASGSQSIIVGGVGNNSSGSHSIIVGGKNNESTNTYSFVGGGYFNRATGANSTIAGGLVNVAAGAASAVGGGQGNSACGNCSAILGGISNLVCSTHEKAFIVGSNITSVASCTLHANCLFLGNIPTSDAGLVAGQVYRDGTTLKIKT